MFTAMGLLSPRILAQAELKPEQIAQLGELINLPKLTLGMTILVAGVISNRLVQSTLERRCQDQAKRLWQNLDHAKSTRTSGTGAAASSAYG